MKIFGVRIDGVKTASAADYTVKQVGVGGAVFTPNSVMIQNAKRDICYRRILNSSFLNVADGSGVVIAAGLLCGRKIERVAGVELGIEVAKRCAALGYGIFIFGGRDGIARRAGENLRRKIPGLIISGAESGYGYDSHNISEKIRQSGAKVVFVCLGAPMQEKWIYENMRGNPKCVFMGLGGSADVYAGCVKRAPLLFRKLGIEFVYRMLREPKRLKFLPDLVLFFISVIVAANEKRKKKGEKQRNILQN